MSEEIVRYAELLPGGFRTRLQSRPLAYLPLGTLEWHGEQLPLGSDALISEGLMIRCARAFGGIVMPPIHLGPDRTQPQDGGAMLQGMDYADVTTPQRQLDGSCYWVSKGLFLILVDAILEQLKRAGFAAVFADGHGPSRASWCEISRSAKPVSGSSCWASREKPDGPRCQKRNLAGDGSASRTAGSGPAGCRSRGLAAGRCRRGSPRCHRGARRAVPGPFRASGRTNAAASRHLKGRS